MLIHFLLKQVENGSSFKVRGVYCLMVDVCNGSVLVVAVVGLRFGLLLFQSRSLNFVSMLAVLYGLRKPFCLV